MNYLRTLKASLLAAAFVLVTVLSPLARPATAPERRLLERRPGL